MTSYISNPHVLIPKNVLTKPVSFKKNSTTLHSSPKNESIELKYRCLIEANPSERKVIFSELINQIFSPENSSNASQLVNKQFLIKISQDEMLCAQFLEVLSTHSQVEIQAVFKLLPNLQVSLSKEPKTRHERMNHLVGLRSNEQFLPQWIRSLSHLSGTEEVFELLALLPRTSFPEPLRTRIGAFLSSKKLSEQEIARENMRLLLQEPTKSSAVSFWKEGELAQDKKVTSQLLNILFNSSAEDLELAIRVIKLISEKNPMPPLAKTRLILVVYSLIKKNPVLHDCDVMWGKLKELTLYFCSNMTQGSQISGKNYVPVLTEFLTDLSNRNDAWTAVDFFFSLTDNKVFDAKSNVDIWKALYSNCEDFALRHRLLQYALKEPLLEREGLALNIAQYILELAEGNAFLAEAWAYLVALREMPESDLIEPGIKNQLKELEGNLAQSVNTSVEGVFHSREVQEAVFHQIVIDQCLVKGNYDEAFERLCIFQSRKSDLAEDAYHATLFKCMQQSGWSEEVNLTILGMVEYALSDDHCKISADIALYVLRNPKMFPTTGSFFDKVRACVNEERVEIFKKLEWRELLDIGCLLSKYSTLDFSEEELFSFPQNLRDSYRLKIEMRLSDEKFPPGNDELQSLDRLIRLIKPPFVTSQAWGDLYLSMANHLNLNHFHASRSIYWLDLACWSPRLNKLHVDCLSRSLAALKGNHAELDLLRIYGALQLHIGNFDQSKKILLELLGKCNKEAYFKLFLREVTKFQLLVKFKDNLSFQHLLQDFISKAPYLNINLPLLSSLLDQFKILSNVEPVYFDFLITVFRKTQIKSPAEAFQLIEMVLRPNFLNREEVHARKGLFYEKMVSFHQMLFERLETIIGREGNDLQSDHQFDIELICQEILPAADYLKFSIPMERALLVSLGRCLAYSSANPIVVKSALDIFARSILSETNQTEFRFDGLRGKVSNEILEAVMLVIFIQIKMPYNRSTRNWFINVAMKLSLPLRMKLAMISYVVYGENSQENLMLGFLRMIYDIIPEISSLNSSNQSDQDIFNAFREQVVPSFTEMMTPDYAMHFLHIKNVLESDILKYFISADEVADLKSIFCNCIDGMDDEMLPIEIRDTIIGYRLALFHQDLIAMVLNIYEKADPLKPEYVEQMKSLFHDLQQLVFEDKELPYPGMRELLLEIAEDNVEKYLTENSSLSLDNVIIYQMFATFLVTVLKPMVSQEEYLKLAENYLRTWMNKSETMTNAHKELFTQMLEFLLVENSQGYAGSNEIIQDLKRDFAKKN